MLVLRSLIEYNIAFQVALNPTDPNKAAYKGLANAIYYYMNLQKATITLPIFPSVGVAAGSPPLPAGGTAGLTVPIPSSDILLNKFLSLPTSISTFLNPVTYTHIFQSIFEWLSQPSLIVSISNLSLPSTMIGSSNINFPAMPFLGPPCWATMVSLGATGKITQPSDAFEIFSNFIYAGLLANYTAPIPTTGLAIPSTGAYSGFTFTYWPFIDVPDFPAGSVIGIDEVLALLGLNGLDDDSLAQKQTEIDLEGQPAEGELTDCNLVFTGSAYDFNSNCENGFFNQVYTSGQTTCASLDLSATQLLTSASVFSINENYTSTSAISAFDIAIPDYTESFPINKSNINIIARTPIVRVERNEVESDKPPTAYFSLAR